MSVDVVGLRALAEKMARAYTRMCEIDQGVGGLAIREPDMLKDFMAWGDATENEHADTVLALLDEITTLRAEKDAAVREMHSRELHHFEEEQRSAQLDADLADRDARIEAALAMADEFEYVSDVDLRLALSGPAVPVPQDNPEAWVTAPDGEEFRRGACQGHDCCTAKLHEHGCFADYDGSKCDHPEAHQSTGEQAEYLCYICGGRPQEQGGVCSDECETSVNTESTVPSPDVRPKNGEKP